MDRATSLPGTPPSSRSLVAAPTPPAIDTALDETTPKAGTTPKITPRRSERRSLSGDQPATQSNGITASISGLIANSLRNLANSLSPETAPPSSSPIGIGRPKTAPSANGGSSQHSPIARKLLDLPGELPPLTPERTPKRDSAPPSRRVSARDSPAPSPGVATSLLPSYLSVNFGSLLGLRSPSPGDRMPGGYSATSPHDDDRGESSNLSMAQASAQGEVFPDTVTTPLSSPTTKTGFDLRPQSPRQPGRPSSRASSLRLHDAVTASPSRRTTMVPGAQRTTPRASMEGGSETPNEADETARPDTETDDDDDDVRLDPLTRAVTQRTQSSDLLNGPPSPRLSGPSHHRSFSVPTPVPSTLREQRVGQSETAAARPPPRPSTARDVSETSNSSGSGIPRSGSDLSFRPPHVSSSKPKKTLFSRLGLGSGKASSSPSSSLPSSPSRASSLSSPAMPRTPSTAAPSIARSHTSETDMASLPGSSFEPSAKPRFIKVRVKNKETKELRHLFLAQELRIPPPPLQPDSASIASSEDGGGAPSESASTSPTKSKRKLKSAVWAMAFSQDGEYLAAAGQDGIVRVWQVDGNPTATTASSNLPTSMSMAFSMSDGGSTNGNGGAAGNGYSEEGSTPTPTKSRKGKVAAEVPVFGAKPLHEFVGHTADVLDLSWSKNNFLLSASMDKTVRLWHISRKDCLSAFLHLDCAVAVAFHPRDDRFFLSGSLDCKLRLWNVPEKRVHAWTELPELITSVAFASQGRLACAGSFTGRCTFFEIETFKYSTQFVARSRRTKKGRKVTAMRALPGTEAGHDKILVTTNDSRIRLFNLVDRSCEAKYRGGHTNQTSQIRASFSDDGRYIITGSEDRHVYVYDSGISEGGSFVGWLKGRADKGGYEMFPAESDIATCCIFAPEATRRVLARSNDLIFGQYASSDALAPSETHLSTESAASNGVPPIWLPPVRGLEDAILVCADDHTGAIRIYRNSPFPKEHPAVCNNGAGSRRSSHILSSRSRAGSVVSHGVASEER